LRGTRRALWSRARGTSHRDHCLSCLPAPSSYRCLPTRLPPACCCACITPVPPARLLAGTARPACSRATCSCSCVTTTACLPAGRTNRGRWVLVVLPATDSHHYCCLLRACLALPACLPARYCLPGTHPTLQFTWDFSAPCSCPASHTLCPITPHMGSLHTITDTTLVLALHTPHITHTAHTTTPSCHTDPTFTWTDSAALHLHTTPAFPPLLGGSCHHH